MRRGANRGTSITKWFLHLSRVTHGIGICGRPSRGCLLPANPLSLRLANVGCAFRVRPPVIAAQSRVLVELIGVLVGAFFLSAWSITSPGICLPDLSTRASGSGAEGSLPREISDITSESGTNPTDRLLKNISAKSDSESSGSVSLARSNPPRFCVRRGVPVLAFAVREVWAVRRFGAYGEFGAPGAPPLWLQRQSILAGYLAAIAGPWY